ncbi:hypothetical protein SEVIR_6G077950v4 [Setaria viridis]
MLRNAGVCFFQMFSRVDELSKFWNDAQEYIDKFLKCTVMRIHRELVCAHEARAEHRVLLASLVKEAKEAYEQADKNKTS